VVPSWFNFSSRYSLFAFGLFLIIIFLARKKSDCAFLWLLQRQKGPGNLKHEVECKQNNKITKLNALTVKENVITVSIIFHTLLQYFNQRCWYYLPVDLYKQRISTVQFSRFICKSLLNIFFALLTVRIHVPSFLITSLDFVTLFCALAITQRKLFCLVPCIAFIS